MFAAKYSKDVARYKQADCLALKQVHVSCSAVGIIHSYALYMYHMTFNYSLPRVLGYCRQR